MYGAATSCKRQCRLKIWSIIALVLSLVLGKPVIADDIPVNVFDALDAMEVINQGYNMGLTSLKAVTPNGETGGKAILTEMVSNFRYLSALHDVFAWEVFLTLNLSETQQWISWKSDYEIFRKNGLKPQAWTTVRRTKPDRVNLDFNCVKDDAWFDRNTRVLFRSKQPTGGRLRDQDGNLVYYEILVNGPEFNYIVNSKLYNKEGQIDYLHGTSEVWFDFQSKLEGKPGPGAIELKLAWKVINEHDNPERFFVRDAVIVDESGCQEKSVGLVGMHIVQKTNITGMAWIWSTFEQVDNVEKIQPYHYKTGSGCEDFLPALIPQKMASILTAAEQQSDRLSFPTVTRELQCFPLMSTLFINAAQRTLLNELNSVWQYYKLIGTQWTWDGNVRLPIPAKLTNTVIETYDQDGSCMGCHSKASVPSSLTTFVPADLSFLLEQAQWTHFLFTIEDSGAVESELPHDCSASAKPFPLGAKLWQSFYDQGIKLSEDAEIRKTKKWWLITDLTTHYVIETNHHRCEISATRKTWGTKMLRVYQPDQTLMSAKRKQQ